MGNFIKIFSIISLFLGCLFIAGSAQAAAGDIVITVTDELGSPIFGADFNFSCEGGNDRSVNDGGPKDDDGAEDGVITVPASFAQDKPDCGDGESFTIKNVEMNGYVTTAALFASYATSTENAVTVSLPFSYKVTILTADNIPFYGATVTAGKFSTNCTEGGTTGVYHCPLLTSDKESNIEIEREFFYSKTDQFPESRSKNDDPQVVKTVTGVLYKEIEGVGVLIPGSDRHQMSVSWTPTADPNFGRYEIHRRETFGGVTHENSTLSLRASDRETTTALISAAGCNEPNYFVVYVIDADGNRSVISDEVELMSGSCTGSSVPAASEAENPVSEEVAEEFVVEEFEEIPQVQLPVPPVAPAPQPAPVSAPAPAPAPAPSPSPNPPVRPNPPAQPETLTPRGGGVGQAINNVAAGYATLVEIVRERISQGLNLKEAVRDNLALLFSIFR